MHWQSELTGKNISGGMGMSGGIGPALATGNCMPGICCAGNGIGDGHIYKTKKNKQSLKMRLNSWVKPYFLLSYSCWPDNQIHVQNSLELGSGYQAIFFQEIGLLACQKKASIEGYYTTLQRRCQEEQYIMTTPWHLTRS